MAKVWRELTGGDASAQGNDSETHDDVDVGKVRKLKGARGKARRPPSPSGKARRESPPRVRTYDTRVTACS